MSEQEICLADQLERAVNKIEAAIDALRLALGQTPSRGEMIIIQEVKDKIGLEANRLEEILRKHRSSSET